MKTYLYFSVLFFVVCTSCFVCHGQDNYEIQVYGAPTMEKGSTMFELHSNLTMKGSIETKDGTVPTNHVAHETVEITHGFTHCFEIGFYLLNSLGSEGRTGLVGSHVRPRICAPAKWHLPVGLSMSAEVGYQRLKFCSDDLTLELRPIIDKTWKNKWYVSLNPVFDKSFRGLNKAQGYTFSPNIKVSKEFQKLLFIHKKACPTSLGLEYYGYMGTLTNI